jgi:uncharacterized ferritin-like protein (DUF455 family)
MHKDGFSIPNEGTIERWCFDFVVSTDAGVKFAPAVLPALDDEKNWERDPPVRRIARPGRPAQWRIVARSPATPRPEALVERSARAKLFQRFVHHELQAAELFAWAVLAFPATPRAFRAGLVRLCGEEIAHLRLYRDHLRTLGAEFESFPVRDWFWERVPSCVDAAAFVALQGVGLEGANLEHSARFAAQFFAVGDERAAAILERVGQDEIAHVAFAKKWFEHFTGAELTFETWSAKLPAPLSASVLQGRPINRAARKRAGLDDAFVDALESAPPTGLRRVP